MTHVVTLVKSESTPNDRFDRGERVILVDGVRWGRTIVTFHGVHGTKHCFEQQGGDVLLQNPKDKYPREIAVRSMRKRRRYGNDVPWRPTEEVVLEKARELVEAGRLRDPKIVAREQDEAHQHYIQRCAEADAAKRAAFIAKARDALGINSNDPSPLVDRVVAAMEWAQTQ
jgi:hypothetical protein